VEERRERRWPLPARPTARFVRISFKTTSHTSSPKRTSTDKPTPKPLPSSKNYAMPSPTDPHSRKINPFARNADRRRSNE